jgi:2-dehydropantoate 2-reductase
MRIIVMGAGSLGCLFGLSMARAGEDVTFISRGAALNALERGGNNSAFGRPRGLHGGSEGY